MHQEVLQVCEAVRQAGGRAMLVGGWVRDRLLGRASKDYDVEVFGVPPQTLRTILKTFGRVNTVGEHFAVYKLVCKAAPDAVPASAVERLEIDVSIPRRESKSGRGHRGFTIEGDPRMTIEEAARRRDFTINAILYDPLTDEFIDPYGGIPDLTQKRLRAVAAETFIEDSLRVLRAVQFAARFEMTVAEETVALCRTIDLADLPHERIWGEVEKLLLMAARPALGLDAALQLGVLDKLFPELRALAGPDESPDEAKEPADARDRPEATFTGGPVEDAFRHTKRALDAVARLADDLDKPRRITVMLATLCHALGNPPAAGATSHHLNRLASKPAETMPGDEAAGRCPFSTDQGTLAVLERLGLYTLAGYDIRAQILALVREQNRPVEFYARRELTTDGDFRRLARRVDLDLLYRVAKACGLATSQSCADDSAVAAADWFIRRARELGVEHGPPAPLLLGRHLLDLGLAPGPQIGELLRQIYERQLDGQITTLDEARTAARHLLTSP